MQFDKSRFNVVHEEALQLCVAEMAETEFANIRWTELTARVQEVVGRSGIKDGLVVVQTLHTTTMITRFLGFRRPFSRLAINEDEEGLVRHDVPLALRVFLKMLRPAVKWLEAGSWQHDRPERLAAMENEPRNAASHLLNFLFGRVSETLIVRSGRVRLGTWQRIVFFDFDPLGRIQQGIEHRTVEVVALGVR